MLKKFTYAILLVLSLTLTGLPVLADIQIEEQSQSEGPAEAESSSGPFSALVENNGAGVQKIEPIDFKALGEKAVKFGNDSYSLFLNGSVPLFVWAIGLSLVLIMLGIFFGKKILGLGIVGVFISFGVIWFLNHLPQIAITIKAWGGSGVN
ncbi:hypothetical protein [Desulfitobacterium chlororespirans]|uniref:Uncharacterized protein n=1 Tax=Desulfitobacterium chlororespirans DSM 11544 TaxID=1121395 RepID=A0A1M7T6A3_9FIRM|nr:hypothetical protein [Desulfitobacterium chlororespirans]SHN66280.1 hypothetical protein SAMN02745215_01646 [Desulfitobacterium chlororespirans DSM 11544]